MGIPSDPNVIKEVIFIHNGQNKGRNKFIFQIQNSLCT